MASLDEERERGDGNDVMRWGFDKISLQGCEREVRGRRTAVRDVVGERFDILLWE